METVTQAPVQSDTESPMPIAPAPRRRVSWLVIGVAAVLGVALVFAAMQTASLGATKDDLRASTTVAESHSADVLAVQQVMGNWFLDRSGGTPFRVLDGDGTVLATGMLSEPVDGGDGAAYGVVGPIEIARASIEVPDAAFYQLEVEGVGGTVTFDKTELAANGWEMAFVAG